MNNNRDIRKKARLLLRENWRRCVPVSLLAALLGGLNVFAFAVELPVMLSLERSSSPLETALALALTVHIILGLCVGCLVELGHDRFYLKLRAGMTSGVPELFSLKGAWFRALLLRLLICGETVLRTLLLIVPGVMALFQYALAPFLMAQNPNWEVPEAVRVSSVLMKGYKARLWRLVWSLFPWFLLCLCTAGLGFLFFIPYEKACMAEFYRERVEEHDADVRRASRTAL